MARTGVNPSPGVHGPKSVPPGASEEAGSQGRYLETCSSRSRVHASGSGLVDRRAALAAAVGQGGHRPDPHQLDEGDQAATRSLLKALAKNMPSSWSCSADTARRTVSSSATMLTRPRCTRPRMPMVCIQMPLISPAWVITTSSLLTTLKAQP